MKTIAILKDDFDKLPDYTVAYPEELEVGTRYKIETKYKGRIDYFVGERRENDSILKLALIVDEIFQSNES